MENYFAWAELIPLFQPGRVQFHELSRLRFWQNNMSKIFTINKSIIVTRTCNKSIHCHNSPSVVLSLILELSCSNFQQLIPSYLLLNIIRIVYAQVFRSIVMHVRNHTTSGTQSDIWVLPFWSELEFVKLVKDKRDHQYDFILFTSSTSRP